MGMIVRGTLYSDVLEMDTGIAIVTPKELPTHTPYKVAYVLHGLSGNHESWINNTMVSLYAEKTPMIYVFPEVQRSFYTNMQTGLNYFDYICYELPQYIQKIYQVSDKKEDHLIVGASMGGFGALKCGLKRPDYFGNILSFSAALLQDYDQPLANQPKEDWSGTSMRRLLKNKFSQKVEQDLVAAFGHQEELPKEDNLLWLAQSVAPSEAPNIYLACGLKDPLLSANRHFYQQLNSLGLPVTYEEKEGYHEWSYFNQALDDGLRWYRRQSKKKK